MTHDDNVVVEQKQTHKKVSSSSSSASSKSPYNNNVNNLRINNNNNYKSSSSSSSFIGFVEAAGPNSLNIKFRLQPSFIPSTVVVPRNVSWSLKVTLNLTGVTIRTGPSRFQIRGMTRNQQTFLGLASTKWSITTAAVQTFSLDTNPGTSMFGSDQTEADWVNALTFFYLVVAYNDNTPGAEPSLIATDLSINMSSVGYTLANISSPVNGSYAPTACLPGTPATVYSDYEWQAVNSLILSNQSYWLGGVRSSTASSNKFCWTSSFGVYNNYNPQCVGSTCSDSTLDTTYKNTAFCALTCQVPQSLACTAAPALTPGRTLNSTEQTNAMRLYIDNGIMDASLLGVYRYAVCQGLNAANTVVKTTQLILGNTKTRTRTRPLPTRTQVLTETTSRTPSRWRYSPTPNRTRTVTASESFSRPLMTYLINVSNGTGIIGIKDNVRAWGTTCSSGWGVEDGSAPTWPAGTTGQAICAIGGFEPNSVTNQISLSATSFFQQSRSVALDESNLYDLTSLDCPLGANTNGIGTRTCNWGQSGLNCTELNRTLLGINCYSDVSKFRFKQDPSDGTILVSPDPSYTFTTTVPNKNNLYGTVCRDVVPDTKTRQILCNLAGGSGLVTSTSASYKTNLRNNADNTNGQISFISGVSSCSGPSTSTSLAGADCNFVQSSPRVVRHQCDPATEGAVGLDCYTSPTRFEFLVANATFNNRLYARHNSSVPWGLVCPSQNFTNETSLFFCKRAQVNNTVRAYYVSSSASISSANNFGYLSPSVPAYLDRVVSCPWYGTDLSSCSSYFQSTQDLPRDLSCSSSNPAANGGGVSVFCVVDYGDYHLKMNLTNGAVTIRDYSNASATWGTLCNKATPISSFTAGALCNLMQWPGVATAQSVPLNVTTADPSTTIYAHDVDCGSSAVGGFLINPPYFQACRYNNESHAAVGCSHNNDDIGVNCHIDTSQWIWNQSASTGAVRVAPKATPTAPVTSLAGSWGSVCGATVDLARTAPSVCRFLGWTQSSNLDTARVAMRQAGTNAAATQASNGTIYFANLSCPSASTTDPAQCTYVESADQPDFQRFAFVSGCDTHAADLEVDCFRPSSQWSLTQRASDGLLYANIRTTQPSPARTTVGSICALQSDGVSLVSDNTATSLCNMLGYTSVAEVKVSKAAYDFSGSAASNTILVSNLTCPAVVSAPTSVFAATSGCTFLESLPASLNANQGTTVSRTTCDLQTDNLVLDYCHTLRANWNIRQVLKPAVPAPPSPSPATSPYFNNNYNLVEVRPSSSAQYGTVCNGIASNPLKKPFGDAEKRAFCSLLGWNPASINTTATTASWKLGSSINYISAAYLNDPSQMAFGGNLSYMSNMTCDPVGTMSSPSPSLYNCNYTESSPTSDRTGCSGYGNFNSTLHLHLDCRTHPRQYEFRINYPTGRLETRPNSTAPWGSICSKPSASSPSSQNRPLIDFSETTALGFCRLLGMPQATWARVGRISGGGTIGAAMMNAPIYLQNLSCPATGFNSLEDCNFNSYIESASAYDASASADSSSSSSKNNLARTDCTHDDDVTIFCFSSPTKWEFRINDPVTNRVITRPNATSASWGGVCASNSLLASTTAEDNQTNQAVCNWLRYPGAITSWTATATTTDASSPQFFLSDLTCQVYDNTAEHNNSFGSSSLANCTYNQSDVDRNYQTCSSTPTTSSLSIDCHSDPTTFVFTLEHQGAQVAAMDSPDNINGNGWGYICNPPASALSTDTNLALCGMLGWPYPVSATASSTATNANLASFNILSGLVCPFNATGDPANFDLWTNSSSNWKGSGLYTSCGNYRQHTSVVASTCVAATSALNLTCKNDPTKWEAKVDTGDAIPSLAGLLWVRPGPTAPWGTVCFDAFTIESAVTFVHMTGVHRILEIAVVNMSTDTALPGMSLAYANPSASVAAMQGAYIPQYLSRVVCPDNQSSTLASCSYVEAGRRTRFSLATASDRAMSGRCNHSYNVGIHFRAYSPTHVATFSPTETASENVTRTATASRTRRTFSSTETLDSTPTINRKNSTSKTDTMPPTTTKSKFTRSASLTHTGSESEELWHAPFIRTAASQLQAAVAMGAASAATLLFREPTPPLTASRALAVAAMSKACRDKDYVTQPFDEPLIFPQQSLIPGLQLLTESDHYINWWRRHYRGAVISGMFVVPFGCACCALMFAIVWQLLVRFRRRIKSSSSSSKSKSSNANNNSSDNNINNSNSKNNTNNNNNTSDNKVDDNEIDLSFLDDFNGNVMNTTNQNDRAGYGGEDGGNVDGSGGGGGGGGGGTTMGGGQNSTLARFRKLIDDIWITSRVPTVVAITLAIALENVTASCVLLLSYDSQGWPYNKSLDRGLAASALVVFTGLLFVAAIKTRGAVSQCDCVDAQTFHGDPPEPWKTSWSRLLYGERCWALSRDTELNRANSDVPAARLLKLHLRFVGPFHGRNLMRPTEGFYRFRLTPWTFCVEMIFTAILGFGRGFLMATQVRCLSAAIWTMALIGISVLWNWILRPRISPLMAAIDFITFAILLVAAIAMIANWRYSDDIAGFGAICIALGTLVFGGLRFLFQKFKNIRLLPLIKTTDIEDIDVEAELMDILGGGSSEEDCFMKPPLESALLSNAAKLKGEYDGGLESMLNVEFENCDDIPFHDLYLQFRDLASDGAAKNAKEVRDVRKRLHDRALEIAQTMDADMRQQLALNRIQRRAEMIAAGRDPDTGRAFKELCDPDRPFRFDDDPVCRGLLDDYRRLANAPGPDAKTFKELDRIAVEIEKRQEALANLSDEAKRRLVREEAKRNADRFRQYLATDGPFERAFTCSDDPEFKTLQQSVMERLKSGVRQNAFEIESLQERMLERAQQLKTIPPYQRQQLADQARQRRAEQIANGIDPDTGKTFDELCNPNREFEYTDDAVYKTLADEYKQLSENPIHNKDKMDALLLQMKLRSKILDQLSPEEKAALVRQTAARNAARLRAQFDWGGDPLGPSNIFLSSDDKEYKAMMDTLDKYLREDPRGYASEIQMLQLDMRLRADELAKKLPKSKKEEMIAQRRKDRLAQIMSGIDPFTGKRFSDLVDDRRAFELDDDAKYRALHDELDFLCHDNAVVHESRIAELQTAMANRAHALGRVSEQDRALMVKESAQNHADRIRRMMNSVSGGGNFDTFLLTDDPEYNALQRQLMELLASGTATPEQIAALQEKLRQRAAQLALLSEKEKHAMMLLRQQNNMRLQKQHGRDPFTNMNYAKLADRSRNFCHWDDGTFDGMARELRMLMDTDPTGNAARIDDLLKRMQRRGVLMTKYDPNEKNRRLQRTANSYADFLQRHRDEQDPFGPNYFTAGDDLLMKRVREEASDLSKWTATLKSKEMLRDFKNLSLEAQVSRFPTAQRLSDAEKKNLLRIRREEAARFLASARDMKTGKSYEELIDAGRPFEFTDDAHYEQLYDEYQFLSGEDPDKFSDRLKELMALMLKRGGELELLSEEEKISRVEKRANRNMQQYASLPSKYDALGAPHFTFTDDPAYKKIHDQVQTLLRRPMSNNANEKLEELKRQLLSRSHELTGMDANQKLRMLDARRNDMLRMRKNGIEPLTGKPYSELCDRNRAFQYTDDPTYRRKMESYLFFASSNPEQHERRLVALAEELKARQAVIEKWDAATKKRMMTSEIERLERTRRRDLLYGVTYTPPQEALVINLDDDLGDNGNLPAFDLDAELANLVVEDPKPVVVSPAYDLDDGNDMEYRLDDDDGGPAGPEGHQGIGAARNEELMRRMMELKQMMDNEHAGEFASGTYELTAEEQADI